MFKFEKGSDVVHIDDDRVSLNFSMYVKKMEDAYLVNIPAYNIHFYTKTEKEIEKSAHESLNSFLNYWYRNQGFEKFLKHMLNLGFTLQSTVKNVTQRDDHRTSFGRKRIIKGEEFLMA